VMSEMPGLVWIRSYISDVDGKIYCEYEAPNPEAIREHARRAGLRVDSIIEIALEISPAMFR
jgi:Nickel responsive protein SCO4226-like